MTCLLHYHSPAWYTRNSAWKAIASWWKRTFSKEHKRFSRVNNIIRRRNRQVNNNNNNNDWWFPFKKKKIEEFPKIITVDSNFLLTLLFGFGAVLMKNVVYTRMNNACYTNGSFFVTEVRRGRSKLKAKLCFKSLVYRVSVKKKTRARARVYKIAFGRVLSHV